MRIKNIFLIVSVLQILLFATSCNKKEKGETDEQKLSAAKALDKQYEDAFNKGSWSAVMATYWNSPELVSNSFVSDRSALDWKQSQALWVIAFVQVKGAKIELQNSKNKVEGDVVLGSGNWELKDSSGTSKFKGVYLNVKARRGDKWVYIMDNFSETQHSFLDLLY